MSIRKIANGAVAACDGVKEGQPCPSTLMGNSANELIQTMDQQGWQRQIVTGRGEDNQQGFTFCPTCK